MDAQVKIMWIVRSYDPHGQQKCFELLRIVQDKYGGNVNAAIRRLSEEPERLQSPLEILLRSKLKQAQRAARISEEGRQALISSTTQALQALRDEMEMVEE